MGDERDFQLSRLKSQYAKKGPSRIGIYVRDLFGEVSYFVRKDGLEQYRRAVETQVAGDPDKRVVRKANRLSRRDKDQPVGANVFAAVANYKMFHTTQNFDYLIEAQRLIDAAYDMAEQAEREIGVKPHRDSIYREMELYRTTMEFDKQRERIEELAVRSEPSKDAIQAVESFVNKDKDRPVGTRVFAAVANYRMFCKTNSPNYLTRALDYAQLAMSLSTGEEQERNVKPHFETILREHQRLNIPLNGRNGKRIGPNEI